MKNEYEQSLTKYLQQNLNFQYDEINRLHQYPLQESLRVLQELVEYACLSQNYVAVELGRKKIKEIDKEWLKIHLFEVANKCINFNDDYEYSRLVELVLLVTPERENEVIRIGLNSENIDVKEIAEDYQKKQISISGIMT